MSSEKNRVFPPATREDKADQSTRVARQIAEQDRAASEKKTAKLRALRLARDAEVAAAAAAAPAGKGKR